MPFSLFSQAAQDPGFLDAIAQELERQGIDPNILSQPGAVEQIAPYLEQEVQRMGLGATPQMVPPDVDPRYMDPGQGQAPPAQAGPAPAPAPAQSGLAHNFVPEGFDERTAAYMEESEKLDRWGNLAQALGTVGADSTNFHNTIPQANAQYAQLSKQNRMERLAVPAARAQIKGDLTEQGAKTGYYDSLAEAQRRPPDAGRETDWQRKVQIVQRYAEANIPPEYREGFITAFVTGDDAVVSDYMRRAGVLAPTEDIGVVDAFNMMMDFEENTRRQEVHAQEGISSYTDPFRQEYAKSEGVELPTPGDISAGVAEETAHLDPRRLPGFPGAPQQGFPGQGGGEDPKQAAAILVDAVRQNGVEAAIAGMAPEFEAQGLPIEAVYEAIRLAFETMGLPVPEMGMVEPGMGTAAPGAPGAVPPGAPTEMPQQGDYGSQSEFLQARQAAGKEMAAPGPDSPQPDQPGMVQQALTIPIEWWQENAPDLVDTVLGRHDKDTGSNFLNSMGQGGGTVDPAVQQVITEALAMYPEHIQKLAAERASRASTPEEAIQLIHAFLVENGLAQ